jgi:DNA invertase Pin-like site-specific DNA recombinase
MLFGYARVSTQDQNLNLQIEDLKKAGCERIFQEKASSAKERPQLQKLLESLREGDTLIVWKLDRLGRSLKQLIRTCWGIK